MKKRKLTPVKLCLILIVGCLGLVLPTETVQALEDLNGNGFVDLADFSVLSCTWQETTLLPSEGPSGPGVAGEIPSASRQSVIDPPKDYLPCAHIFPDPNWFHWGGSCIRGDDGRYHLFYARWPKDNALGMSGWLYESQIAHATADNPEGPYQFQSVVLEGPGDDPVGRWDAYNAHNPCITRFVDPGDGQRRYYLYFIANRDDDDSGISDWYDRATKQRIGVAVADSPDGPWVRYENNPVCVPDNITVHWYVVNPAVCQLPDGRFLMLLKGRTGQTTSSGYVTGWALADSPVGPFVIQDSVAIPASLRAEDPCVWVQDGKIYSVVKDWYGDITGTPSLAWMWGEVNGDSISWQFLPGQEATVTTKQLKWSDGVVTSLSRLERPFVLLDQMGRPGSLFCAASVDTPSSTSLPFNVCIPLEPPDPALQRINVALEKPAVQSSTWTNYPADKAVDGLSDTFAHTAQGDTTPYWEVDLGDAEKIGEIVLVNRSSWAGRLRDIRIEIFDSQRQNVYTSDLLNPGNVLGGGIDVYSGDEPAELSVVLPEGIQGTYIRVVRMAEGSSDVNQYVLTLAEVKVYNPAPAGDLNNDWTVDILDLQMLAENWLE